MARTAGNDSRQDAVYVAIRRDLLRAVFAPGHWFKVGELSSAYGVSVSVIREAMTRLAAQGLVLSQPNRGYRFPTYSVEDINDLAMVRSQIEAFALHLAVSRGDANWEATVVAAHHRLSLTPNPSIEEDPAGNAEWARVHREFHEACAAGCASPNLLAIREQLYDRSEIVRQLARLHRPAGRDVAAEHRAQRDALVARDGPLAQELICSHIEHTRRACVDAWFTSEGTPAPAESTVGDTA